jgi:hypothetical protein
MLIEPIFLTLYDPKTHEPLHEYQLHVITFAMLISSVQLQEALAKIPEKKRRWWWQKPIRAGVEQINALLGLVVEFFGNQFTVEQLRTGADVSEVMTIIRAIIGRGGGIINKNPTVPPARRNKR